MDAVRASDEEVLNVAEEYDFQGWHVVKPLGPGGPGYRTRRFGLMWRWWAWTGENFAAAGYRAWRGWSRSEARAALSARAALGAHAERCEVCEEPIREFIVDPEEGVSACYRCAYEMVAGDVTRLEAALISTRSRINEGDMRGALETVRSALGR